jgi:hypothetical protein
MSDERQTDEDRSEKVDRLIKRSEILHLQAKAARERTEEALKRAAALLGDLKG